MKVFRVVLKRILMLWVSLLLLPIVGISELAKYLEDAYWFERFTVWIHEEF